MKINLDIDGKYDDTEVIIRAPHLNNDIERIVAMMRMIDMQIAVRRDNETYLLETDKILYVEAVDRKTFVYTNTDTYESELKLYELEQILPAKNFFRANKAVIVNLNKIKSISPAFNGRFEAVLKNEYKVIISRSYVPKLKEHLGL